MMTSLSREFLKFFIFLVASILLDICGGENVTSNNVVTLDIESFNNKTDTNKNQNTTSNTATQHIENLNNETDTLENQTAIKGNETWIESNNKSFECLPRTKRSSQGDVSAIKKFVNIQSLSSRI